MKNYVFLFDLDSTLTCKEILPELARSLGKGEEMKELTEKTMRGELPFKTSFLERVKLLSNIPIDEVLGYSVEIINKMGYFNSNSDCPTKYFLPDKINH